MALSQQVEDSLNEAQAALRNALAFAARNERPVVCNAISESICRIEQIQTFDGLMDKLEEHYPGKQ
jgi:hypothetical protein